MTYRIYFGGGEVKSAWIIQSYPDLKTVAAVAEIHVKGDVTFPLMQSGPKPNGVAIIAGTLRVEGSVAWIEA